MATYSSRSLNQIITEFQTIANNHRFIHSFACGTFDDFATSGDTKYPAMWMQYDGVTVDRKTQNLSFKILVCDRVKKDRTNLQEVLSDTLRTLHDFRIQIEQPAYGWEVNFGNATPVYEEYMEDEIAGWESTFDLTQPFVNDVCAIPYIVQPTPTNGWTGGTGSTTWPDYVPTSRTLTINGVSYDLSADRSWTITASGGTWGSITGTLSNQTDLQTALNAKQNTITTGTTAQYFRGDLSLATFPTNVSSFTNDAGYITSSSLTGYVPNTRTLTINGTSYDLSANRTWTLTTTDVAEGTNLYWTSGRFDTAFAAKSTTNLSEGTNLYYTNARADARIAAAIGVSVQAYDADLTSWAAITRAAGFDTFVATPSSANLAALLTDEGTAFNKNFGTTAGTVTEGGTALLVTNNLSDLNSAVTARSNLGAPFTISSFTGVLSPADSTTYYWGNGGNVPTTTASANAFNIGYAFKIIGMYISVGQNTTQGTSENVAVQIRNVTQATSTSVGNITTNATSTSQLSFAFTGLNISVAAGDSISFQTDTPAWSTNPVSTRIFFNAVCIRA